MRHNPFSRQRLRAVVLAAPFFLPAAAAAADSVPDDIQLLNTQARDTKVFSFDYGIPASPALTLAGLADSNIKPETSLKPFVLALPGLLSTGSSQTSAALDISPAWALNTQQTVSQSDYYDYSWFYRARLGVALFKGDDGGGDPKKVKASRIAFGISTSLLPDSDPLSASVDQVRPLWLTCEANEPSLQPADWFQDSNGREAQKISNRLNAALIPNSPVVISEEEYVWAEKYIAAASGNPARPWATLKDRTQQDRADLAAVLAKPPESIVALNKQGVDAIDKCQKEASDLAQHGKSIDVGAGVVWNGDAGKLKNFKDPAGAVWVAARFPLGKYDTRNDDCGDQDSRGAATIFFSCWTVGGTARYSVGEFDTSGSAVKPLFKADVIDGWAGLEHLTSAMKLGGYIGYTDQHAEAKVDAPFSRSRLRWLVSGALSLSSILGTQDNKDDLLQGVWLEGSYGAASGTTGTLRDNVALLTLSFAPPKIGSTFASQ